MLTYVHPVLFPAVFTTVEIELLEPEVGAFCARTPNEEVDEVSCSTEFDAPEKDSADEDPALATRSWGLAFSGVLFF